MATMNISLPDGLKKFAEEQAASGHYSGTSDYVRDLIRQDAERRRALADLNAEIQKGLDSGPGQPFDVEQFIARKRAERAERSA